MGHAQESIEILSERTPFSKLYRNSDGSKEQVISPQFMHYQKGEDWHPLILLSSPTLSYSSPCILI